MALAATAAAALVAALVGAALIPVSAFGLVPQNYYWLWAVGAFVTIALVVGASAVAPVAGALRRAIERRGLRAALVVVLVAVAAVAVWPRYPVRSVAEDENEAARIGRPLRAEMARAFSSGAVGHTVEVDLSRAFFGNNYPFVMLAELQNAGVEFRFAAGSGNLDRFGDSRCVDPGRLPRLFLIAGKDPPLEPGSVVAGAASSASATTSSTSTPTCRPRSATTSAPAR